MRDIHKENEHLLAEHLNLLDDFVEWVYYDYYKVRGDGEYLIVNEEDREVYFEEM